MLQLPNQPAFRVGLLAIICIAVGWTIRGTYEDAKQYKRLSDTVREANELARESVAASNGVEQSAADLKTATIDAFRRFEALYKQSVEKAETLPEESSNGVQPSHAVVVHVPSKSKNIVVSPLDIELDRNIIGLLNDVRAAGYGHASGSNNGQSTAPSPN